MTTAERNSYRVGMVLPYGRAHRRSSYDLARSAGIPQRSVGFAVNRLRRQGILVGSVHGEGYYLIETASELAETLEHIERRKRGIDLTLAALRHTAEEQGVAA